MDCVSAYKSAKQPVQQQEQWMTSGDTIKLVNISLPELERLIMGYHLEVRQHPSDLRKRYVELNGLKRLLAK